MFVAQNHPKLVLFWNPQDLFFMMNTKILAAKAALY